MSADQQSSYQNKLNDISKQIKQLSANLNTNKKLLKSEQSRLLEIEQKILAFEEKIIQSDQKIGLQQDNIDQLEQHTEELNVSHKDNKQALSQLVYKQHVKGEKSYLKMALNQQNPYQVGRLSHYYQYYTKAQNKKMAEIQSQIAELNERQRQHQQVLEALDQTKQRQVKDKQRLGEMQQQRKQIIDKLDAKMVRSSNKIKQLQQDRDRLKKLLKEIIKKAAELKRLEKLKKQPQKDKKTDKLVVSRIPVKGGFKKQKGRLNMPVKGKARYKYGSRLAESGMKAEGILIETNGNQNVKSIFRGRVVFADWLKGYGLLLIIDHGDDHISLYGHNQLLYKKVGDAVESGEIVSKTGHTGGQQKPAIYFEIRHHATPVNPALWCK